MLLGTGAPGSASVRFVDVASAQQPCTTSDLFWGDYDDMVWLGGNPVGLVGPSLERFYTTFTRNGFGACPSGREWTVPQDVYGATLL